MSYEAQGIGYDPRAVGHELQGRAATRCGCDPAYTDYKLLSLELHPDTDTVTVTTRALCCGRTFDDEITRDEFARTWSEALEGPQ